MRIKLTLLICCLFSFSWAHTQDQLLLTKKEAKYVKGIFQEAWTAEALVIPNQDSSGIGPLMEGDRIYILKQQDIVLGYLLSTRALGRFDYFDYLLVFAPDFSVLGITITVYRSSHGAAICQKRWLSQFEAYAGGELTFGKDIDAIAGATISATSLTKDVQRCFHIMTTLKEQGLIP